MSLSHDATPVPIPIPALGPSTLGALTPNSIVVDVATLIDVTGAGFVPTAQVLVDNAPQPTTFIDSTHLQYHALTSSVSSQAVRIRGGTFLSNALLLTVTPDEGA